MLIREAHFIAEVLADKTIDARPPMLNVGSSTAHFRRVEQPIVHEVVFEPLTTRGFETLHLDLKAAEGVDIVGDLLDPATRRQLAQRQLHTVLCSNLLEHVGEREQLCRALIDVTAPGGVLIVTVPRRYPYHADPIDTLFRPTPQRLAALFAPLQVLRCETVADDRSFYDLLRINPIRAAAFFARLTLPFYQTRRWRADLAYLPYLSSKLSSAAVVLRKPLTSSTPLGL